MTYSQAAEYSVRKKNLLRNPAVRTFFSAIKQQKFTFNIGNKTCRVVSIFAMGSSGLSRSRDIDIDIVFEDDTGFDGPQPSVDLSTELLKISNEANTASERKFQKTESDTLWPEEHIELVVWPVYVGQFENPELFQTQIPGDKLRSDGAGGIANYLHLNEMIQTGVTLWKAPKARFTVEGHKEHNSIDKIHVSEALEYLAIAMRDLAKAYMQENIEKRDYLIAKAILRMGYVFCIASGGRRIDRYEDVPVVYKEEINRQKEILDKVTLSDTVVTVLIEATRAFIDHMDTHFDLLENAAKIRRQSGQFKNGTSMLSFRLFSDMHRFVELTFLAKAYPMRCTPLLKYYKHRTLPDLRVQMLSMDTKTINAVTEFFIQELALAESPSKDLSVVRYYLQNYLAGFVPTDSPAFALLLRCSDTWLLILPKVNAPADVQFAMEKINSVLNVEWRFKQWHESVLTSLIESDRIVEAYRRIISMSPQWRELAKAIDREKYISSAIFNIHWVLDFIASVTDGPDLINIYIRVLSHAKKSLKKKSEALSEINETGIILTTDIETISKRILKKFGYSPEQYCCYLENQMVKPFPDLIADNFSPEEIEMHAKGMSNAITYRWLIRDKLANVFFQRATENFNRSEYETAITELATVQDLSPRWSEAHFLRAKCNARTGRIWEALRDTVKGAFCGSKQLSIDRLLELLASTEWNQGISDFLDKIEITSEQATQGVTS